MSDLNGTFVAFGGAGDRRTVVLVFVVAPRVSGLKCHYPSSFRQAYHDRWCNLSHPGKQEEQMCYQIHEGKG